MCDTCPAHIPGPGEVAASAASMLAKSKTGRKVLFRVVVGFCIPLLPFALVDVFGWWLVPIALVLAAGAAVALGGVRFLHRGVVVPPATPAQRVAELERRRRNAIPIPAARPVLPRNLSIGRGRRALPAPAKALPAAAHEFVAIDWDKGCGHLAHPQASRCFLPAKDHLSAEPITGRVVVTPPVRSPLRP